MRLAKFLAITLTVAIVVTLAANGQPPPGGGGPKGGKGQKGLKGQKGGKAANTNSEQLLEDLKLTDEQTRKAREIVRAHDETMRQASRAARQELLAKMKDVISESDFKTFKEELDQIPLLPSIPPILRVVATDDLVERLLSYDKNGDGIITKDELPERMHALIEQGDTNGNGSLDREEMRRLGERSRQGGGPGGPRGPGGGGPPRGPGGPRGGSE